MQLPEHIQPCHLKQNTEKIESPEQSARADAYVFIELLINTKISYIM